MDSLHRKDRIEELLEENQRLLQIILKNSEKTRKYILWGRIISTIYLIVVVAPIILAIIYLPPLIRQVAQPYRELLSSIPERGNTGSDIINQIENLLNSK